MLKSSFSCRVMAICLFVVFGLSTAQALAGETVEHYRPNTNSFSLDEYSRKTSSIDLVYSNNQGGDAKTVVSCGNPSTGSWAVSQLGNSNGSGEGKCYDFEFCYDARTDKIDQIIATDLAGKKINSVTVKPNTEGKVSNICYQITKIVTPADVRIYETSKCSPSEYQTPKEKELCVFDEDRVGGKPQVIVDTGDDMFKFSPQSGFGTNGTFLEYPRTGGITNPSRLNWIERSPGANTSKSVMIPAGPINTYSDFTDFMRNPPIADVKTEDACYPVNTGLCEEPPPPPKPPTPGLCGPANGRNITGGVIPPGDRCYVGNPSEIVQSGSVFTWSCSGMPDDGSQAGDQCQANAATELYRPDPSPQGEYTPPTTYCFFHVSGGLISNRFMYGWYTQIGTADDYSNLVGPGDYTQAQPFARAHATTFDGIAIGRDTHVTIYGGPNFTGRVILDTWGPYVLNNYIWRSGSPEFTGNPAPDGDAWLTQEWPGEFHGQFPPSSRHWSTENMHPWGGGTSLKVECAPLCSTPSPATETKWLPRSQDCPAGEEGTHTWQYEQARTAYCPATRGAYAWGGWAETGNRRNEVKSCAPKRLACKVPSPSSQTRWTPTSKACPAGYDGVHTWEYAEKQTASCPSQYGDPVWSGWTATGSKRNEVDTCTPPEPVRFCGEGGGGCYAVGTQATFDKWGPARAQDGSIMEYRIAPDCWVAPPPPRYDGMDPKINSCGK